MEMEMPEGCGWPKVASACPVWDGLKYVHPDSHMPYDISQQDVPCVARSATCRFTSTLQCEPGMRSLDEMDAAPPNQKLYYQLKPGSPATCGHGNREFSFFAHKGPDTSKVLVVFASGGMCWDADTCGNPMFRSMAIDALQGSELAPAVGAVFTNAMQLTPSNLKTGILSSAPRTQDPLTLSWSGNAFADWSVVVIPDCTGDQGIGSRSYTYDAGHPTCITAHHHGGVNTGLAIHWMLENFHDLDQVLLVGTGPNSDSMADGGHGIAFWSTYIKKRAGDANVRTVIDSSMGLFGPGWREAMMMDPWGTQTTRVPDADMNGDEEEDLLFPAGSFDIAHDDVSYYLEWATAMQPTLSFMDVTSVADPVQRKTFMATGGRDSDCCIDGCNCNGAVLPRGVRGGRLDWTKTRKVQMLRRYGRMPLFYRGFLQSGDRRFLLMDSVLFHQCADQTCQDQTLRTVHDAVWAFANSMNTVAQDGTVNLIDMNGLPVRSQQLMPSHTCGMCLPGGVQNGDEVGDKCLASMGEGENLFSVASKYGTDWMALWSLNGDSTLEVRAAGMPYRFAHEYEVQAGESMEEVAARFGTTVDAVVDLNYNLITHIQNPARLKHGDQICIVPVFHQTMDRHGSPICPSDRQRFGEDSSESDGGMGGDSMQMGL